MLVLGIESSCDETAAAVVENGRVLHSNIVLSQNKLHRTFKGIVPEIASRAHLENMNRVVEEAIGKSRYPYRTRLDLSRMDAIAVTTGPGLVGSLLVGKMTAQALGWIWNKPVIGINHLEAHLFSNLLEFKNLTVPFMGLVVSGGHTDLVLVENFGRYKVIGRTRDDAAGESFDKVSSILNLSYPGGPVIDQTAKMGNPKSIPFPRPYLEQSWDFSFSGLKTAVLYHVQKHRKSFLRDDPSLPLDKKFVRDTCASFQAAVVDVLTTKTIRAAKRHNQKKIAIGGGVSANSLLRQTFSQKCRKNGLELFMPSKKFCTDNAAMIASLGYFKINHMKNRPKSPDWRPDIQVDPSLPIKNWS